MRRIPALVLAVSVGLLVGVPAACGESPPADPGAAAEGQAAVIKTLPGIVVDTKAGEVRLEGKVVQRSAALELFLCGQNTREHESVLVTRAKPSHVTFALALLGLEPGKPGFATEGGAFSPPAGEVVDVLVRFTAEKTEDGKKVKEVVELPAWRLLRPAGSEHGLERAIEWVYVGRPEQDALKAADREGTVIGLSNFRDAVIDVPFESSDVNASLLYQANPEVVPEVGTPVEILIRPAGKRIAPQKVEIQVLLLKGKPPMLDGKSMDLQTLRETVNGIPASVRSAVLRADAEESFGRVMEVRDVLRDALMSVHLMAVKGDALKTPDGEAPAPLPVTVTADDKVRVGDKTVSLDEFRKQAGTLLKGVERVVLSAEPKGSWKTVAEVMTIARECGVVATVSRNPAAKE